MSEKQPLIVPENESYGAIPSSRGSEAGESSKGDNNDFRFPRPGVLPRSREGAEGEEVKLSRDKSVHVTDEVTQGATAS